MRAPIGSQRGSLPSLLCWLICVRGAGAASIATYLQAVSYRYGSTHFVATFGYCILFVAGVLGWGVISAVPDAWSIGGMTIVAAAGIVIVFTQHRLG